MIIAQLAIAFLVAWFYYMVAMAMTVYDGVLSMIFQPIMGAIFAGLSVVLCFVLGLPLRYIAKWRQAWQRLWWLPFLLSGIGFVLLVLSWQLPFRQTVHDYTAGLDIQTFQPAVALSGWLLSVFAALHFWFPLPQLLRRPHSKGHAQA